MSTTKRASGAEPKKEPAGTHHERYEKAVEAFASAVEMLYKRDYETARARFVEIQNENADEPTLVDRARTYVRICEKMTASDEADPSNAEDYYYRGVLKSNEGSYDEALSLFDSALSQAPDSAKVLYARASTWALKGDAGAAVADLRRAINGDPTVRFQAANDPDFEPIREEPAFIDIIEPTPSGG